MATLTTRIAGIGAATLAAGVISAGIGTTAAHADAGTVHYWTTCSSTSQYANLHAQDYIRTLPQAREIGYNGNSDPSGWSMVETYNAGDGLQEWGYVLTSCIAPDPRYGGTAVAKPAANHQPTAASPAAARSGAVTADSRRTVCADSLYVRDSPAGQVIGTLLRGESIDVDEYSPSGQWAHGMAYGHVNTHGWVESAYLC